VAEALLLASTKKGEPERDPLGREKRNTVVVPGGNEEKNSTYNRNKISEKKRKEGK